MSLFLSDLHQYPFLQYALIAALLASLCSGIMGTYVVVRRRTYIVGAISHCLLAGMGAARYAQTVYGWSWATPLLGAVCAALLVAVFLSQVSVFGGQREDTILSAVWAVGMAIGISFISATPGYNEDLMSYLFGNILMVSRNDLVLMGILDVVIAFFVLLFFDPLLAISFHEETARLKGVRVRLFSTCLLILTALTVVLLVQVVGIVMVIAMLTLPAAAASQCAQRLSQVMVLAVMLSAICMLGGLVISYAPGLPAGATVVELAGGVYVFVLVLRVVFRWIRQRGGETTTG